MHLRPPSIDPGVTSFIWALVLGLFIWSGLLAIGISQGTALLLGLLSFGAIFLFIRLQGGDDPVRWLDDDARCAALCERHEQEARKLAAESLFEALEGGSPPRRVSGQDSTVFEQQLVAALALRKRGGVHGPLRIGATPLPSDP
jgi:hypothetical protein